MRRWRNEYRDANMQSHDELVTSLMARPGVCAEVDRLEREESAMLDALLKARQDLGGIQAPSVAT